ncbi:MAG: glycosyltransferase [Micrococcales bacterium]|nr:glycosyltransferase [Micrococcales bacterium]
MRILFDGYWWGSGSIANRTVQREFILAWTREFPDDEAIVAVRRGIAVTDLPPGVRVERRRLWPHALSNRIELSSLARRLSADGVLAHNFAPRARGSLTFVHDLMFVEHPEWFSWAERRYFAGMVAMNRGQRLASSTATEARRIERWVTGSPRVHDVGLAVGPELAAAEPSPPAGAPDVESFAMVVGRLNERKNVSAVIEGAAASASIDPAHPLLIVGGSAHSGVSAQLSAAARAAVGDGTARFLGTIDDAALAWLYRHTALVIFLSLDEGFGLPALEGAWFGAPLLVSDIPVFRETVGSVAHVVDPRSPSAEIARAIDAAWAQRPDGVAVEQIRARYSWERSVHGLRDAMHAG